MMDSISIGAPWLDRLLPEGFPVGPSTLISGPGGSGKPLIAEAVVGGWLRQGGSVIFMSLQYPTTDFIVEGIRRVAGLELGDYAERVAFVELDIAIEGIDPMPGHHMRANVVIPEVWDSALTTARKLVPSQGPGVLLFASAINLLLFSPTYGAAILRRIHDTMASDDRFTVLFSASTTAKRQEIATLEAAADNLWMTRSEKDPMRLYLQIRRMVVAAVTEEAPVPIPSGALEEVKAVAHHSRRRVIPQISKL
jgi:KaiC/GvpD/RAD55 family RecA-like ATPase